MLSYKKKKLTTRITEFVNEYRLAIFILDAKVQKKLSDTLHGGPGGALTEKTISMFVPFLRMVMIFTHMIKLVAGSGKAGKIIEEYTTYRHKSDLQEIINKIKAEKVTNLGNHVGSVLATFCC
jgi:hypothetical protein